MCDDCRSGGGADLLELFELIDWMLRHPKAMLVTLFVCVDIVFVLCNPLWGIPINACFVLILIGFIFLRKIDKSKEKTDTCSNKKDNTSKSDVIPRVQNVPTVPNNVVEKYCDIEEDTVFYDNVSDESGYIKFFIMLTIALAALLLIGEAIIKSISG